MNQKFKVWFCTNKKRKKKRGGEGGVSGECEPRTKSIVHLKNGGVG